VCELQEKLEEVDSGTHRYKVSVKEDKERNLFIPNIEITAHGVPIIHSLGTRFFAPMNMPHGGAWQTLQGLIEEGAYVKRGEREQPVTALKRRLTG